MVASCIPSPNFSQGGEFCGRHLQAGLDKGRCWECAMETFSSDEVMDQYNDRTV